MNRREFLLRAAALAGTPIVLQIAACGDDGTPATPADRFTFQATTGPHGHTAQITCAQLQGGADVTLANSPDGIHPPHTDITLTATQLSTILGGGSVTVHTTSQGHDHDWVVSRPAGVCA